MTPAFSWVDWIIVAASVAAVLWIGLRTQRYVKSVADFLTAGRVAGRYVICVSGAEASMGLISLVAMYESYYQSGFAYGFWGAIASPIFILLGLTGYCTYRFRETRAMTMGQFLEIRYSRHFRIFAGILQSISGIVNYGLFPAVGARFFIYFCNLPINVEIFGLVFPTFALLMAVFLGLAVLIATMGGQVTIMVTDCVQGLLSYPMYVIIVVFILIRFSWFNDLAPVVTDRAPGSSMINPFDIKSLRDFNLFYVVVGILSGLLNRMSWSGSQGYNGAARNAHEQKMGGVLGTWRAGFSWMMYALMAVVAYAYLNGDMFQSGARGAVACRTELAVKAVEDVVCGDRLEAVRNEVVTYLQNGVVTSRLQDMLDKTAAAKARDKAVSLKQGDFEKNADIPVDEDSPASDLAVAAEESLRQKELRFQTACDALQSIDPGTSQTFATIVGQMRVPLALRYILPTGILGIFCAICIFLMLSTDTTYLHSWGSILVQDIVLPLRKTPFTPKQQITMLRLAITGVAIFAFFFSYFFGQVDYILMFFAITGAIWIGGAGICITAGLYWRRGTTSGAWAALISGSTLSVLGILLQKNWVDVVYPWLCRTGWVEPVGDLLQNLSGPFEPIIKWRMDADKFPINSQEIFFATTLVSVGLYVAISLLTSRRGCVFNIERMLHRGAYHREDNGLKIERARLTWRNFLSQMIGIDNQYTRGDKILAWAAFIWSFGWSFMCCFVGIVVWNLISPWGNKGFTLWFFINNFIIAGLVGAVSTVWFTIGGTQDLRRLFRDLQKREVNENDDGRVECHISSDDLARVAKVEQSINETQNDDIPSKKQ